MSIFGTILSKIFPANHPAVAAQSGASAGASQPAASGAQQSASQPGSTAGTPAMQQPQGGAPAASSQGGAAQQPQVDVERVLDDMAQRNGQKLDWRHSIVDLMKLLGLDSSLNARKTLAQELHYTGDTSDSATMNIWLHKQVMQKLAENGGKVPQDLIRH